jgi:hypothetical protein
VGGDSGGVSGPGRLIVHTPDVEQDQWFPWSDTDAAGNLHVGYMDASIDGVVRRLYGFSNAVVPVAATPANPSIFVSSAPSDPNESLFFRAGVPACPDCATFIGDYNGLATGPDGKVHSVWTDMRRTAPAPFPARKVEDAFYASIPAPAP